MRLCGSFGYSGAILLLDSNSMLQLVLPNAQGVRVRLKILHWLTDGGYQKSNPRSSDCALGI